MGGSNYRTTTESPPQGLDLPAPKWLMVLGAGIGARHRPAWEQIGVGIMRYRVLCEEDLLQLLDELNQGHDGVVISQTTEDALSAKIDAWARTYRISATRAKRELRAYFAEM